MRKSFGSSSTAFPATRTTSRVGTTSWRTKPTLNLCSFSTAAPRSAPGIRKLKLNLFQICTTSRVWVLRQSCSSTGLHSKVSRTGEEQWTHRRQQRKSGEKVKSRDDRQNIPHITFLKCFCSNVRRCPTRSIERLIFLSITLRTSWLGLYGSVCNPFNTLSRTCTCVLTYFVAPLGPLCPLTPITENILSFDAESKPTNSLRDQSLSCMKNLGRCAE